MNDAEGGFQLGNNATTSDGRFMNGYLDVSSSPGVTLSFTNLNSLTNGLPYSVLVYTDGDTSLRRSQFTLAGATTGNGTFFTEDNGNFPGNGTTANYVRSTATTDAAAEALTGINNYVQFDGVTGNSFTLQAFGTNFVNGAARAPINGIQIVTVPEPTALVGLIGGAGMLLGFRRRSR